MLCRSWRTSRTGHDQAHHPHPAATTLPITHALLTSARSISEGWPSSCDFACSRSRWSCSTCWRPTRVRVTTRVTDSGLHAVLPYAHYLSRFTDYLQHLDLESNGEAGPPGRHDGDLPDRSDRVGNPRDQPSARLLPAHPPGHEADPRRLHCIPAPGARNGRAPRPTHHQRPGPGRGARVRAHRERGC